MDMDVVKREEVKRVTNTLRAALGVARQWPGNCDLPEGDWLDIIAEAVGVVDLETKGTRMQFYMDAQADALWQAQVGTDEWRAARGR